MATLKFRAWKLLAVPQTAADIAAYLEISEGQAAKIIRDMTRHGNAKCVNRRKPRIYKATSIRVAEDGRGMAKGSAKGRQIGQKLAVASRRGDYVRSDRVIQLNGAGRIALEECWKL